MAKTYGLLPSQVRDNATTYDIKVTEALVSWENRMQEEASTGKPAVPNLDQKQMLDMIAKVKVK